MKNTSDLINQPRTCVNNLLFTQNFSNKMCIFGVAQMRLYARMSCAICKS